MKKTAPALSKEGESPLRGLRYAKGLSQEALSVEADVGMATIGRAEKLGVLSGAVAAKLALALGVDPVVLFGGHPADGRGKP
jgi:transcriptional regulator with XRE-family HTH domain